MRRIHDSREWYEQEAFWEHFLPLLLHRAEPTHVRPQVDQILDRLGLRENGRILDLGCGIGRHCLELARRGYVVTGVDLTERYLELARAQAQAEDLAAEFIKSDMRDFRRENAYDGIISMFTSFGYFTDPADDGRVLRNAYDSLRPGGAIIIDAYGKEQVCRTFHAREWSRVRVEGREVLVLQERELLPMCDGIRSHYIFIEDSRRAEFTTTVRIYAATEFAALLKQAGFAEVEIYGDLSGEPYDHTASRLIAVARK